MRLFIGVKENRKKYTRKELIFLYRFEDGDSEEEAEFDPAEYPFNFFLNNYVISERLFLIQVMRRVTVITAAPKSVKQNHLVLINLVNYLRPIFLAFCISNQFFLSFFFLSLLRWSTYVTTITILQILC